MDQDPPVSDELIGPFLELLQILREACGGDLEKNMILLAVAVRTIQHPDFRMTTDAQRREIPVFPSLGVNARSIADSTGIPRETVRRKVADLLAEGWIAQVGRNLHYTGRGYRALTPAREALVRLAHLCHAVIQQREAQGSDGRGE